LLDLLLDEWSVGKHSPSIKACLRRVLGELKPEAQLLLRGHPRLQVVIRPGGLYAWPYFPIYKQRRIVRELADAGLSVRVSTRVLLVISEELSEGGADFLRDALGHVLLYLQHPRAKNGCPEAMREWNAWRNQFGTSGGRPKED
jgi:hypothetical protein